MNEAGPFLIDSHCHLDLPAFADDLADVLKRANEAGFFRFIIPGISLLSQNKIIKMAELDSAIFFSAGIHPNDAAGWRDEWLDQLKPYLAHPKCVAVGEIGLDFYREFCDAATQERAFRAQLDLAEEAALPVIIHCRNAFPQLWRILAQWHSRHPNHIGVLHSFDETSADALMAIEHGFYLGISGTYTYVKKNERREEILRVAPLSSLLIETDCPYLSPVPYRGVRNEPAFARSTAAKIAAIRNISIETVISAAYENTLRLFPKMAEQTKCRNI